MEVEELKERYRGLPVWGRMAIAVVLGLLPAAYIWLDEAEALEEQLEESKTQLDAADAKLKQAVAAKKRIPQIEERLAELEEQLVKAKKALPDTYRVEEVLQKTAAIAKESGVRMTLFNPEKEVPAGQADFRYMQLPIATEIEGKFNQVATYLDKLVHLEHSIFIKSVDIGSLEPDETTDKTHKSEYQIARENRQNLVVRGKVMMAAHRSMSEKEMNDADVAEAQQPGTPGAQTPPAPLNNNKEQGQAQPQNAGGG